MSDTTKIHHDEQGNSPRHKAALAYAKAGISVFVCRPGGKEPATEHGFKDATTDIETINRWFADDDYNLAIEPERAGWCVIDIDGDEGEATWRKLCGEHGQAPETRAVTTPNGGRHLYFNGSLPPSANDLGPKVDTRGRGSYVLVPPSVVNGRPYTVEGETRLDPPEDWEIAALPDWISTALAAKDRTHLDAPAELDGAENIHRAQTRLKALVAAGDVAIEGEGGNDRTYRLAAELINLGLSPAKAQELLLDEWNPHCDPPWGEDELETIIGNAWRYKQNAAGSWGAMDGNPFKYKPEPGEGEAEQERARIDARFMLPVDAKAPLFTSSTLSDFLYDATALTPRRDIIPDWIEAGGFIPLCGPGGYHKSRLLLQLVLCKLFDRTLFVPRDEPGWRLYPCGGVAVGRFEMLSYEQSHEAMRHRIETMKAGFINIPTTRDGTADRFIRHKVSAPILIVDDRGETELTPLGHVMLHRWEDLAKADEHLLLWFDSFFDAVSFSQKARVDDGIARRVIRLLDHWCKELDATILAPFHPSRSGQDHGHTGYAPAFENVPQQVLRIGAKREKVRGGGQYEFRETGEYIFEIHKWNNGSAHKRISFWFDQGQLVSATSMHATTASASEAAVKIITSNTYGEAAARFTIGTTTAEADEIERSCTWRVRGDGGKKWKVGHGKEAIDLTTEHFVMDEFRRLVGNDKSQVRDFIQACDAAVKTGEMGYREADKTARSSRRLPAGYYVKFPELEESFADPEM
jgi:hypothetical protein